MARYGSDFTGGRYSRMGRDPFDTGYDAGFRGRDRWDDFSSGRGHGWNEFEGSRGRGTRGRGFNEDLDESWSSMSGRRGFGEGYGLTGYGRSGFEGTGSSFGTTGSYIGRTGYPRYGSVRRSPYDREIQGYRGRMGHDYDQDLGDRLRHGWSRFRENARGWMGRDDYDRGW